MWPVTAMRPSTPEPGSTFRPSSSSTQALSPRTKDAVSLASPAVESERPMPIDSDEPRLSVRMVSGGQWRRKSRLTSALHIAPDETTTSRLDRSKRSGASSSARTIGRANASPTMAIALMPSPVIASSVAVASNRRLARVTTQPPFSMPPSAVRKPVPCIRGHDGSETRRIRSSSNWGFRPSMPPDRSNGSRRPSLLMCQRSSNRHMTPLGMPVVPPVYSSHRSSPLRGQGASKPSESPGSGADPAASS